MKVDTYRTLSAQSTKGLAQPAWLVSLLECSCPHPLPLPQPGLCRRFAISARSLIEPIWVGTLLCALEPPSQVLPLVSGSRMNKELPHLTSRFLPDSSCWGPYIAFVLHHRLLGLCSSVSYLLSVPLTSITQDRLRIHCVSSSCAEF